MTPSRPRVILDCNILVQAVLSPDGPGRACVELADAGVITLVTSRESLAEARDVLNRPEIRRLKPELSPADVARFLETLAYRSVFLRDVPHVLTWARDAKDTPYLNLAVAGEADYLVTRDKDLLSLNADHSAEGKRFRQLSRNRVRILPPTEFLQEIRSAS
jgi:putative PIN family toxin of toxin-antitoxin system